MWKVFAADDEGYIREALEKLFDWGKMDCSLVAVIDNGAELIERIEREQPDIVITDIQMPEMDGMQVCKYLSEHFSDIEVIILTAYADFEYARKAISYDVCDYVLKISIVDELPRAIEKAKGRIKSATQQATTDSGTLLDQINDYIRSNYTRRISLENIADAIHMNGSYLSRLYKNKTGSNLFDALCNYRIEVAKNYLEKTDMRAYEISEAVGFEDPGYFSKIFKKVTGYSPKDYRKRKMDA